MAVAFGPEQFRQAGEGLTPPPSITLAESQRRAEEPEGEFGQYGSEVEAFRAFRKYVQEVTQGTKDVNVIGWRRHGLYAGWVRIGRPPSAPTVRPIPPADVTRLADIGIDPEVLTEAEIPFETPTAQDRISEILKAKAEVDESFEGFGETEVDPETGREGFWGPDGWFWERDEFGEFQRTDFDPARRTQPLAAAPATELTPFQQAQEERQRQEFQATQQRLFQEGEATRLFREQQFGFQEETRRLEQEQFQLQLTADREERLAQLAAQPISWLQHAALSGQTPVVQPWMIPLMRPGQNLQVGQPLPGFQAELPGGAIERGGFLPGTATPSPLGTQFANLPELRRPSAQLFARMGPTAQQQFLGFRQARTGIPPQETLFRQRQTGPPGSGGGGFQQQRFRV